VACIKASWWTHEVNCCDETDQTLWRARRPAGRAVPTVVRSAVASWASCCAPPVRRVWTREHCDAQFAVMRNAVRAARGASHNVQWYDPLSTSVGYIIRSTYGITVRGFKRRPPRPRRRYRAVHNMFILSRTRTRRAGPRSGRSRVASARGLRRAAQAERTERWHILTRA